MFDVRCPMFDVPKILPLLAALFLILIAGCATPPPLPKLNLNEPGWTIRQGQAVWHARPDAPEIAGDLLVAFNSDGRAFVQFTKSPLSIAVAQKTQNAWQVEFPMQNKRYAGHGRPPTRIVWLLLPGALEGKSLPHPWKWQRLPDDRWRLANPSSGETLEGYLAQ